MKDRQHNGQNKKDKRTNNNQQNIQAWYCIHVLRFIIELSIKSTEQFPGTAYPSGAPDISPGF
jgi:hypothetical protein